jgi:hypothetical protein
VYAIFQYALNVVICKLLEINVEWDVGQKADMKVQARGARPTTHRNTCAHLLLCKPNKETSHSRKSTLSHLPSFEFISPLLLDAISL